MNDLLDVPTLLITNAVACVCICVSLVLIWRTSRGDTFILWWSLAYGLGSATMLLVPLRHLVPDVLPPYAAGALLLGCFGALWLGYRQFDGVKSRFDPLWAGLGVVLWYGCAVLYGGFADLTARAWINGLIEQAYLLAIAIGLARRRRNDSRMAIGLTLVLIVIHMVKLTVEAFALATTLASTVSAHLGTTTIAVESPAFGGLGLIETSVFCVFIGLLQLVLIGQRSQQRFRIAAETDELTGLANRRSFLDTCLPQLAAAVASPPAGALILFDIDHFKRINDTFGHPAGDRALARFAATLAAATPMGGTAARLGGEEFALFLPESTLAEAGRLAERIRRDVAALRVPTRDGDLRMTVSCGVAGVREVGADYDALHYAADRALYTAKHEGRDQVAVYAHAAAAA